MTYSRDSLKFFTSLNEFQREALIECAHQALRDELQDSFMRENEILSITDEELDDLIKRIKAYWEEEPQTV